MVQEPDFACPEGLVELLFELLKKRPKQYQEAVKAAQVLLEKVAEKVVKSKQVRQSKKEKVKQKMEAGEYLPKEVYEIQREHKRDKVMAEIKQGKKRREKEIRKKKEQAVSEKGKSRSDRPARKTSEEDAKPVKRYEPRKFEKGEQMQKPNSKPMYQKPVRAGGFDAAAPPRPSKPSHPSWEAKKELRKLETSVKFIKGEEIEL